MLEPRLGIEAGQLVGSLLHRARIDAEPLGQVVPPVGDEVGECLVHQPVGECRGVLRLAQLEQEALAQVAGPDAGRVELLNDREHLLEVGHGVEELGREVGP